MSRRAIDPVERAFEHWRGLTEEQQRRLADRQYGWCAAQGILGEAVAVRVRQPKRKPKAPAAATGE